MYVLFFTGFPTHSSTSGNREASGPDVGPLHQGRRRRGKNRWSIYIPDSAGVSRVQQRLLESRGRDSGCELSGCQANVTGRCCHHNVDTKEVAAVHKAKERSVLNIMS